MPIDGAHRLGGPPLGQTALDDRPVVLEAQQLRSLAPAPGLDPCMFIKEPATNGRECGRGAIFDLNARPVLARLVVGDRVMSLPALALHLGREQARSGQCQRLTDDWVARRLLGRYAAAPTPFSVACQ